MTPTHDTSPDLHERFLLGDLTAEEHDRLEHRLLADPDLFEQVESAEDELVDRYARGELSPAEHRRFEERLLSSPRIHVRVRTARTLHRATENTERQGSSGSGRLLPLGSRNGRRGEQAGSPNQWLAWAACLVSLVAAGVLALTSLNLQDQLDRVQQAHRGVIERALSAEQRAEDLNTTLEQARADRTEIEQLRQRLTEKDERIATLQDRVARPAEREPTANPNTDDPILAPAAERATVFLTLAMRTAREWEAVQLPLEGGELELQLGLDRIRPEGPLTVTLSRSGVQVWKRSGVEPVHYGQETMASVTVPAETLLPGTYRIEVTEQTGDELELHGEYGLLVRD